MGSAASLAAEHSFKVRDEKEAKCIQEEKSKCIYHITAQILFLCGRARRDIQTAVSFLTTRVKNSDEYD